MEDLRISASNLGLFVMPDFCERCAWLLLKMRHRFPFQRPFPGIMFYLDRQEKASTHQYMDANGKPPGWFGPFSDGESYIETGKLTYTDPESGIELRGAPDEVLVLPDDSLVVIDYKTARHKEGKDVLMPRYEVQVNAYAYLLMHQEEAYKANKGGLLYFQIRTDYDDDELLKLITRDGLDAHFHGVPVVLEIDPEKIIPPLLLKTQKLFNRRTPPAGRDGCKDCELLTHMATLAKLVEMTDKANATWDPAKSDRLLQSVDYLVNKYNHADDSDDSDLEERLLMLWDFTNEK